MKDYTSDPPSEYLSQPDFADSFPVTIIDDSKGPILVEQREYGIEDLVKYWCGEKPSPIKSIDDFLYYEHQMRELEFLFFMDVMTEGSHYAINETAELLKAHDNKPLTHLAFLEKIIYRRNELLTIKENEWQPYPVRNQFALTRLELLIEYVRISLQKISLPKEKLHWHGNFSHFVEIIDALSLTSNFSGLSALDVFIRIQDFIEFDEPKSVKTFEVTMHKNRIRKKNNTPFIESLLANYKNILEEKRQRNDKLKLN